MQCAGPVPGAARRDTRRGWLAWGGGGNLTGVSIMATALDAKRLELVSELAPHATVIAALVNLNDQAFPQQEELEEAARARGIQFHVLRASSESEIDEAF